VRTFLQEKIPYPENQTSADHHPAPGHAANIHIFQDYFYGKEEVTH
jgi:hypothetical protein